MAFLFWGVYGLNWSRGAGGLKGGGRVVGGVGMWGLHIAAGTFAIYSGYHGISATVNYRAAGGLGQVAGIVGIVTIELVLMSLYLAWHNGRITGGAQTIAAGVTGAAGFILACLGIVADSQLRAGVAMSPWLSVYLLWGLPIAPAVMALGALLVHELDPGQLRARREAVERVELEEARFAAHVAGIRAELEAGRTVANMQLNARAAAAKQVAAWYGSDQAQRAITATALKAAPSLLRSIGVDVDAAASSGAHAGDLDRLAAVTAGQDDRLDHAAAAGLDRVPSVNGKSEPPFFGKAGRP